MKNIVVFIFSFFTSRQTFIHCCDPNIPSRLGVYPDLDQYIEPTTFLKPPHCGKGEFLDWYKCSPCEDGTFMTEKMAEEKVYLNCKACYQPGEYETVEEPCSKTRDTMIMCEDGFYRWLDPDTPCKSECVRCDICNIGRNMFKPHEVRECAGHNNTICCQHTDMIIVGGECVLGSTITSKFEETTFEYITQNLSKHAFTELLNTNDSFKSNNSVLVFISLVICCILRCCTH